MNKLYFFLKLEIVSLLQYLNIKFINILNRIFIISIIY